MTPIQQMLLGAGGAAKKTYIEDVFSTYLYTGNTSARSINNGIDLSSKGGLVWTKSRSSGTDHYLGGPDLGTNKLLRSNSDAAEDSSYTSSLTSFNSNGFSLGTDGVTNGSAVNYTSWTFRKAPGFFDVVTYTGTGSKRTVSHSLGCKPGMIMIKRTDTGSNNWDVWVEAAGPQGDEDWSHLVLNSNNFATTTSRFGIAGTDDPTSTTFTVKDQSGVNASGGEYVAYVFAGGRSTAATARSVDFDGSGDYLTTNSSSDYTPGTGDFTLEYWYKPDENAVDFIVDATAASEVWSTYCNASGLHKYYTGGTDRIVSTSKLLSGIWHHIAVVRISGTVTMYINGKPEGGTYSDTTNYTFNALTIGRRSSWNDHEFNGKISNLRYVVGTGVYTSAFRPPTEPLTNITNTKLLCCNSSSVTGATVGTINSNGDPTASTDSPFDDPAGFVFGENGDQGIIKCGSYIGNGDTSDGPIIDLGWEPQWVMIKRSSGGTEGWAMFDSMRGIISGYNEKKLEANTYGDESGSGNYMNLKPTGFMARSSSNLTNNNGDTYIYIAIRRPDGYVGKPAETGTSVFNIDTGSGSSGIPTFDSTFITDMGLLKVYASATGWDLSTRLTQGSYIRTHATTAEATYSHYRFDSNVGWADTMDSTHLSYMWKRHAGFDVVTYTGNGSSGRAVPHSMNKIPEMIWVKYRHSGTYGWVVYHKGLNGGSSPEDYYIRLDTDGAEGDDSTMWNDTAPTSSLFTVGNSVAINQNGQSYIAMLFASVDGISKCGFYDGSGSSGNAQSIGFQPRFLVIKRASATEDWMTFDTVRGISNSGADSYLKLNAESAAGSQDFINISSTGFEFIDGNGSTNASGSKYIYYAHA